MENHVEAAEAVDWFQKFEAEQHETLIENIDKFMNAPLIYDANPSLLADIRSKIYRREKLDDRLKRFAQARGFCASAIRKALTRDFSQSTEGKYLGETYDELEPALFRQIAYFEASFLAYLEPEGIDFLIDDSDFNKSLKLLTALGVVAASDIQGFSDEMASVALAVDLVSEYYQKMDYMLAIKFYKTHHRGEPVVRIGPFSASSGHSWFEIDRPAVVLNEDQQKDFCDQLAQSGQFSKHTLDLMFERIGSEPAAFTLYTGI
jgi:hypothetical protein